MLMALRRWMQKEYGVDFFRDVFVILIFVRKFLYGLVLSDIWAWAFRKKIDHAKCEMAVETKLCYLDTKLLNIYLTVII